ncbi:MAG: hypothetical protein Q9202_002897 [Teloschistes flavicans]
MNINRYLGQHLSPDSSIYLPTDQNFGNLTDRWSDFSEGDISIVVEPASTQDVAATVKFAKDCALPFLAVGQGHGSSFALHTIQHGVSINLQKLRHIRIAQDGICAIIGGGVNTHDVRTTLAAHGKVTATTNAGCTGLLGPGLGGGFGNLLGYFGLILDNIIDMTVVLANGDVLHVSSTSHPDLYWGMRGAGQNFGIVTEATFKIYDMPTPIWSVYEFDFPDASTQLETLFSQFNVITAMPQPKELASLYVFATINSQYSKTDNYDPGGMKAGDTASTAYPHRDDDILVSFDPIYPRSTVSDAIALDVATKFRATLHASDTPGRNFTAYLNYANGDEPIEALYGYESWRLDRVRRLKKKYDPSNKFKFFNPFQRG